VIEVYTDPAMTPESRIHSADSFDIGEYEYIYVKAVGAGTTELVLALEDPIVGERPLSDVLVVNVNA
jgi:hypothetical protein